MNLTFGITGACVVNDAVRKPKEWEIAAAIERLLKSELNIHAIIYVSDMCEEGVEHD